MNNLTLPDGITIEDLKNLNTNKLREVMLSETYLLQLFLFSQARNVSKSLNSTEDIVSKLEDHLFNEDILADLSFDEKMDLYKTITKNKFSSLKFMQDLQSKSIPAGFDQASQIDRMTKSVDKDDNKDVDMTKIKPILDIISKKLKEKTLNNE